MYKFRKCELARVNGHELVNPSGEWFLVVETFEELEGYLSKVRKNQICQNFENRRRLDASGSSHVADAHDHIARIRAERNGCSWIEALDSIYDDVNLCMLKCIQRGDILYIRSIGSYCVHSDDYDILKEIETEKLIWPEPVVKINRWQNGKHWYATVDGVDVSYDGEYKWNTRKEAQNAVDVYLGDRSIK